MKKRIVFLVSGNGSNAQAIIDQCRNDYINGEVVALISNRPNAYALVRAEQSNIATQCIDHTKYAERHLFDNALASCITKLQPDLIVLAGFMRILTTDFVAQFEGKMLNIHPSLLPKYPGLNTHQRAIESGDTNHGASVHFVTSELDGGPVVLKSQIKIREADTPNELAERVAKTEWKIYPEVVKWFCEDRLQWINGAVYFDNKMLQSNGMVYDEI
jgi:phosphoribosylglycinamide formyltransferase-1